MPPRDQNSTQSLVREAISIQRLPQLTLPSISEEASREIIRSIQERRNEFIVEGLVSDQVNSNNDVFPLQVSRLIPREWVEHRSSSSPRPIERQSTFNASLQPPSVNLGELARLLYADTPQTDEEYRALHPEGETDEEIRNRFIARQIRQDIQEGRLSGVSIGQAEGNWVNSFADPHARTNEPMPFHTSTAPRIVGNPVEDSFGVRDFTFTGIMKKSVAFISQRKPRPYCPTSWERITSDSIDKILDLK